MYQECYVEPNKYCSKWVLSYTRCDDCEPTKLRSPLTRKQSICNKLLLLAALYIPVKSSIEVNSDLSQAVKVKKQRLTEALGSTPNHVLWTVEAFWVGLM